MAVSRLLALVLAACFVAPVARADEGKTASDPKSKTRKTPLNKAFRGRVVGIKKNKVTLYYDFEDPIQLEDFEDARPPRLLDAKQSRFGIEGGRLVVEGSSGVRHKMEGIHELRAKCFVRVGQQSNIGTFFSEPALSDFYVVLNLFDDRFYEDGGLILAACGLHEDEGADDLSTGKVNWRDIFRGNAKKAAKVGEDVELEVMKDGWTEYCRVNDLEGRGSSKGKTTEMTAYKFGFWVHHSRASFDDLTITFELSDEYLDHHDLSLDIAVEVDEIPTTGPFAGMEHVPPKLRADVDEYAAGKGDVKPLVEGLGNGALPEKVRKVIADVIRARKDPKSVPPLVDVLYSEDKTSRGLGIDVIKAIVGKSFGYSPTGGETARSKAIQKLNAYLAENKQLYYR
jgi:hypothetical protein